MKTLLQITLVVSALTLLFSCDRKSCVDVVCPGNNQTCFNGECGCEPGYEGPNCDIDTYEKYLGSYNVSQSCTSSLGGGSAPPWTSTYISWTGGRKDIIKIGTFAGIGPEIDAYITGPNDLIIPDQDQGGIEVSGGEGHYNGFYIYLEYIYRVNSNSYSCKATLSPR